MEANRRKFKISEVEGEDDYSPGNSDQYEDYDPQQNYDIQYGSGESGDEYIEREDYPMCQQVVYDSEEENRSLKATNKKRHSDPSELEKYFFYGVGGGNVDQDQSVHEDSEYSDNSETSRDAEQIQAMRESCVD